MDTVLNYLSPLIKNLILQYINQTNDEIEEIRIRANRPLAIRKVASPYVQVASQPHESKKLNLVASEKSNDFSYAIKKSSRNVIFEHIISSEEILHIFNNICEHSIYSYQKQICQGFITIKGGHRVGITGNCVLENGKVININYISSLNFRIAKEKKGCSKKVLKYILNTNNEVLNTLIVSKPGCGKTTLLRDIIREISQIKTCGIVDERGEISAMFKGVPQNDIGPMSDVIENISKSDGMRMLIRTMAPEVIACDEIGSKKDIDAINYAVCSGVKGIFTVHGSNLEDLRLNNEINTILNKFIIETIIFLDDKNRGNIKSVYYLDKTKKQYITYFNIIN